MGVPVRRGRRASRWTLPLYLLAGSVGAIVTSTLTTLIIGTPWTSVIGVWCLGFGAMLGIEVALYLSFTMGPGATCPRCRGHNRRGAEICEVCDLPLEHFASAFWPDVTAASSGTAGPR